MSLPAVSILLPVYNAEKYLKAAMDSLLSQAFTDFELIIVNDGSTDGSEEIALSYSDKRIVYLKNESNKGLIYTLNRGIESAKGRYVARMDADDICLPTRLQKQVEWLEMNPETSVVGCHVSFIDDKGFVTGEWEEDLKTATSEDIKRKMVWENCIAHPAVMTRSQILKRYRYRQDQKNTEDYDLWLRMLADGLKMEKVPEKLLLYRAHDASITGSILRKSNPFFKQLHCKRRFLLNRIKKLKWGRFETQVLVSTIYDGLMGIGKNVKASIKG